MVALIAPTLTMRFPLVLARPKNAPLIVLEIGWSGKLAPPRVVMLDLVSEFMQSLSQLRMAAKCALTLMGKIKQALASPWSLVQWIAKARGRLMTNVI